MPAEWEKHEACWVAWPSHAELWGEEDLAAVQLEFISLCRAISYAPPGEQGEKLKVLAPNPMRLQNAREALSGLPASFFEIGFGDIWLRDTGPIFLRTASGSLEAGCFVFNGWGEKFNLRYDDEVSQRIAETTPYPQSAFRWILEGGSVEVDGQGTLLTTEQCLLNRNRNSDLSRTEIEGKLREALGAKKILWLRDGLTNDHTDGHIDTLARFIAPGKIVCMRASGKDDPNAQILKDIEDDLRKMQDAQGRPLEVFTIPSPGRIESPEGKILAASYVNFYISNHSVVVPTYGSEFDSEALKGLAELFPGRRVIGSPAMTLLRGGGAFHCITQQEPVAEPENA